MKAIAYTQHGLPIDDPEQLDARPLKRKSLSLHWG